MASHRKSTSVQTATLWFGGSYGVAVAGYLAVNAVASRLLGTAAYGQFIILVTAAMLLGQLGLLGINRSGLRAAARLREDESDTALAPHLRATRTVTRLLLPAVAAAGAAAAWALTAESGLGRWMIALGVGGLVIASGHQKLWSSYLRGFGSLRTASLLEGRSGGTLVALLQALLLLGVLVVTPTTGLAGALAAMTLAFVLPVLLAKYLVRNRWSRVRVTWRPLADLRLTWSHGARFTGAQASGFLNAHVDIWLAGVLLAQTDASLFAAAQRLVLLLLVPLTSLQMVFSPVISRLYAQGQASRLQRLLRGAATLAALSTVVPSLPVVIAPEALLGTVFGGAFRAAAPTLLVLSCGYLVHVASGMCATALAMTQHEGIVAVVQWAGVAARICLGVAVVSLGGGLLGLSVSAAGVTALTFVLLWWQTHRRLGMMTHLTLRPNLRLVLRTAG